MPVRLALVRVRWHVLSWLDDRAVDFSRWTERRQRAAFLAVAHATPALNRSEVPAALAPSGTSELRCRHGYLARLCCIPAGERLADEHHAERR